jgi:hypothetical protein
MANHAAFILATTILAFQAGAFPMQKRTIFSPVRGQILLAGKPVAQLEVVQRYQWLSVDDGEVRIKTDANGRFAFPEVSVRKLRQPKEVFIVQELDVMHQGAKVTLWNHTKQNMTLNGELGDEAIELVADLEKPAQEVKLPVAPGAVVVINGVATFRHPYLERWAHLQGSVTAAGAGHALKRFLASPQGLAGLKPFFPAVGAEVRSVTEIVDVKDVRLSDGFLYTEAKSGSFAVKGEPRFIGFTTHAQLTLKLDSGEQLSSGFFAWTMFLPIDESGHSTSEVHFSDRWEIDVRNYIRSRAEAVLVPSKVAALVRARLQEAPEAEFLEAFALKPGDRGLGIEGVEVDEVRVDGVKDDWAVLRIAGRASVRLAGRESHPRFRGTITVQLASLGDEAYRLSPGKDQPRFKVLRFRVSLATDKKVYAPGEKIVLKFQVENLMDSPQRFLKWHSPFEGFHNDFLDLEPVAGGEKVGYTGPLASRGPPRPESFLPLGPLEKASSEIEITECYPVSAKGDWVLRFKPLDQVEVNETRFSIR